MRVLLVSPAAEFGGAERCLLDFVTALRSGERQVEIEVLALADGPLLDEIRALGVATEVVEPPSELAELGESGGLRALHNVARAAPASAHFLTRLRHAILKARPDIVHTNGMKAHLFAGVLAPAQARVVVHLHDFIGARRASKWLLPALAHVHRRIVFVANSQAVAADFKQLAPKADVRTVYNVVDTDYFSPGAAEPEWLATCAGLGPPAAGAVSFGLVATYARWKGHELFIDAAGRLRAAHPNLPLRFYIVGGPIYKTRGSQVAADDLLNAAQSAKIGDCFGLVRFQKDIARVYRSLNVVVHASTQPEPFGRTIVEAMACERPVIVSNAGGAAELFQHGENAVGFSPGNVEALANTMSEVLDEGVRVRLGRAARTHAVVQFGSARLREELLGVYGFTVV